MEGEAVKDDVIQTDYRMIGMITERIRTSIILSCA